MMVALANYYTLQGRLDYSHFIDEEFKPQSASVVSSGHRSWNQDSVESEFTLSPKSFFPLSSIGSAFFLASFKPQDIGRAYFQVFFMEKPYVSKNL